ncbi:hypothetical protein BEL04_20715 [Mucilaginibacter sp. PPCGB 2223]|uniref:carboxypeptidase-like regulatory domain-containing protein n=1 Tax=Mucilaginibacter sp. PPCGB 2223 TaxID=1886027 RepID=UPI00082556FB|nr:carboxypeptidase-like regulatory domain-containing protein [Mucilaginibacter sp. PPCGB 2223]OCX51135.1 hypothetical protein BEL04_20715 [Mucilaginibacter sp. PPCGB 2223]
MKYQFSFLLLLISSTLLAQISYPDLITKIQSQEIKFPFPQKDTTVRVGEININNNNPVINYAMPVEHSDHIVSPGSRESSRDLGLPGPNRTVIIDQRDITNIYRVVNANRNLRVALRFTIRNWVSAANTLTLTVGSQTKTVHNGESEILFNNVLDVNAYVTCYTNGNVPPRRSSLLESWQQTNNILKINWHVAGAGIVTLPVLPVKIVYAPVVDSKKLNTSSISNSTLQGYSSSFQISSVNSTTTPISTGFTTLSGIQKDLGDLSKAFSLIDDPDVKAAGAALNTVNGLLTDALGSQAINQTVSNSVTNQQTYAVSSSETETMQAKASNGGPGDGDVICFYTDVKLLWCQVGGKMEFVLLGYNPTLKTPSAWQLKAALGGLVNRPPGARDAQWNLDARSIASLLALDPFTGPNGAQTQLDPARFSIAHKLDGSQASFQNGGVDETETVSHQVTASDLQSTVISSSTIEVDKPGFLSFLGLGETGDRTIQSTFSKSASVQLTNGQSIVQSFTLHGDGLMDHYYCEVYFDNVFGTFAFRDNSTELSTANSVAGTVENTAGRRLSNASVRLNAGLQSFWTTTDSNGHFQFRLPVDANKNSSTVTAGSAVVKLQ